MPVSKSREELFQDIVNYVMERSDYALSDAEARDAACTLIAYVRELMHLNPRWEPERLASFLPSDKEDDEHK